MRITEGPLARLFARAVVVADGKGRGAYHQRVPEIADKPDCDTALQAL
jgi:thiol peroxidase